MERQSDERRNGTDTTGQESRQHSEPTDRQPPAAIHIMGGERNDPRQASTGERDRQRNQSEERKHATVAPQPPTPRPSCRKTERDAGTEPTDEMRISPLLTAAEPTKQADRRNTAEETA